ELGMLSKDLRKELGRLSTSHGEMIKKDDHTTRMRATWDALKELRTDRSDLSVLRERCSVLLEMIKAGDAERARLLTEVRQMREKLAGESERQTLVREIRTLRERIAQLEGGKPGVVPAGHTEVHEQ